MVCHSQLSFKYHALVQYPTLSKITWDYLSIQGSAIPSEHAFSRGGLTATACHNQLSGDIFEALQILKSGCCNGHISVSTQAEAHFAAYMEELVDLELDDCMFALDLTS